MTANDVAPRAFVGATITPVPTGWRLIPDPSLNTQANGRVLIGGSPLRVLRLNGPGAEAVSRWFNGEPVGASRAERRLARRLLDGGLAHPRPVGGPSSADVEIVIPTFDRAQELRTCLPGCAGFHTIVVDDGSLQPESVRDVADAFGASLVRRETNGGPGAARNSGFESTAKPFVAFVDSDCRPAPGWLETLLPHFEDAVVGAVAPRICQFAAGRRRIGRALSAYDEDRSPLDMGARPAIARRGTAVPYVPGAVLVVRRTAMVMFEESMRCGEDVDFVWRMSQQGWWVLYDPTVQIEHEATPGMSVWISKRVNYNSAAAVLERRHPGSVPALHASIWSLAPLGLMAMRRPLSSGLVAGLSILLLHRRLSPVVPQAGTVSARIIGMGLRYAGTATLVATRRSWWPLALIAALRWRKAQYLLGVAAGAAALDRPRDSKLGVVTWTFVRTLDDAAAGVGLWLGCFRHRTPRPLVPRIQVTGRIAN